MPLAFLGSIMFENSDHTQAGGGIDLILGDLNDNRSHPCRQAEGHGAAPPGQIHW